MNGVAMTEFKTEAGLIEFLDSLHEMTDDGALTNRKWEPAQRAMSALSRDHQHVD